MVILGNDTSKMLMLFGFFSSCCCLADADSKTAVQVGCAAGKVWALCYPVRLLPSEVSRRDGPRVGFLKNQ